MFYLLFYLLKLSIKIEIATIATTSWACMVEFFCENNKLFTVFT